MLVVSRTEGEAVSLPDLDVAVRVLRIAGSRVRIGIDAPEHLRVLRSELAAQPQVALNADDRQQYDVLRQQLSQMQSELAKIHALLERGEVQSAQASLSTAISSWSSVVDAKQNVLSAKESQPAEFPCDRTVYAVTQSAVDSLQVRESADSVRYYTRTPACRDGLVKQLNSEHPTALVC